MLGSELWLLLAVVALNRWLLQLAECSLECFIVTVLLIAALLWTFYPTLAQLGATPLLDEFEARRALICIVICCESWVLTKYASGNWRLLSAFSVAGLIYLLASLFQSGWLSISFEAQAGGFIFVWIVLAGFYRLLARVCNLRWVEYGVCLPAIWLLCWLGAADWPQPMSVAVLQPSDTLRLLLFLFGLTLITLLIQRVLRIFNRSHGIEL